MGAGRSEAGEPEESGPGGFVHRGVVEGFYGPPWSHAERLALLARMGRWGLNRYVYAPKEDPLHRAEWRDPYPPEALAEFAELVETGERHGVQVGFALSPGLSITYSDPGDVAELVGKYRAFHDRGARFFSLALDDVPSRLVHEADRTAFDSLGEAHAALQGAVFEALPDSLWWLVPTDYLGTEGSDDLAHLGRVLPPEIEVAWTGRTVVSPEIRAEEAAVRARCLGRRLLLWDNTPVNDGPMRILLHLGPYTGRDPRLAEHASGVLLNPMGQSRASGPTLASAAAYLRDPASYDPEAAWIEAVRELGQGAVEAFALFAAAHRFSAQTPEQRDPELEAAWQRLARALDPGPADEAAFAEVEGLLEDRIAVAEALRRDLADRALLDEVEPWIESHHRESRRMQAALRSLRGIETAPNALARVLAFFALEGQLTRLPPAERVSFGPRRALYPQLTSMLEDDAGLGPDPALYLERNLGDEWIRYVESRALSRLTAR